MSDYGMDDEGPVFAGEGADEGIGEDDLMTGDDMDDASVDSSIDDDVVPSSDESADFMANQSSVLDHGDDSSTSEASSSEGDDDVVPVKVEPLPQFSSTKSPMYRNVTKRSADHSLEKIMAEQGISIDMLDAEGKNTVGSLEEIARRREIEREEAEYQRLTANRQARLAREQAEAQSQAEREKAEQEAREKVVRESQERDREEAERRRRETEARIKEADEAVAARDEGTAPELVSDEGDEKPSSTKMTVEVSSESESSDGSSSDDENAVFDSDDNDDALQDFLNPSSSVFNDDTSGESEDSESKKVVSEPVVDDVELSEPELEIIDDGVREPQVKETSKPEKTSREEQGVSLDEAESSSRMSATKTIYAKGSDDKGASTTLSRFPRVIFEVLREILHTEYTTYHATGLSPQQIREMKSQAGALYLRGLKDEHDQSMTYEQFTQLPKQRQVGVWAGFKTAQVAQPALVAAFIAAMTKMEIPDVTDDFTSVVAYFSGYRSSEGRFEEMLALLTTIEKTQNAHHNETQRVVEETRRMARQTSLMQAWSMRFSIGEIRASNLKGTGVNRFVADDDTVDLYQRWGTETRNAERALRRRSGASVPPEQRGRHRREGSHSPLPRSGVRRSDDAEGEARF